MATVVLGVDPGGQYTGLVLRRGNQLIDHLTITRGHLTMAAHLANVTEAVRLHLAQANLLAVEDLNDPSPHMGLTSVRGLIDTAQVLGAVLSHWPTAVVVPPGGHGSGPLLAYPRALHPTRGRGRGKDRLRHERSAWDVAGAGLIQHRITERTR